MADKGKNKASADSHSILFDNIEPPINPLLLAALYSQHLKHPTAVQRAVLPLSLQGKDVLVRARTGSGKTLAYAIPILQGILLAKGRRLATDVDRDAVRAIVLVPTKELCEQVTKSITTLCENLGTQGSVRVFNSTKHSPAAIKPQSQLRKSKLDRIEMGDRPDIVVSTPSSLLQHLRAQHVTLSQLSFLVLDEADLILSYGHSSEDIKSILHGPWTLPSVYQSFLVSATITSEVEELKGVVLRNPVVLDIQETEEEIKFLKQFSVRCSEEDKFLLLFVMLRLKLVDGKCLIFVNSTDRSYRIKLFLEKFGIRSGVLNAELPFNSRYHAVEEFNRGVFRYLIATDESGVEGLESDTATTSVVEGEASNNTEATLTSSHSKKRKRKVAEAMRSTKASEYGVSRGIDFVEVACVLNFDLPSSSRSYTHRVGRTARAGRSGTALSFVVPKQLWGNCTAGDVSVATAKFDEDVWNRIERSQKQRGAEVNEYQIDGKQVEGFRYRMEDGLRAVTRAAVKEARIEEIKREVLHSDKLKTHFEAHPEDLAYLKHDRPLYPSRIQPHMKHVPSYLMPRMTAKAVHTSTGTSESLGKGQSSSGFHKQKSSKWKGKSHGSRSAAGRTNPLKNFSVK